MREKKSYFQSTVTWGGPTTPLHCAFLNLQLLSKVYAPSEKSLTGALSMLTCFPSETRALDRRVEEYLHSALQFYELAGEQASHSVAFTHAALARHHASLLARRMGMAIYCPLPHDQRSKKLMYHQAGKDTKTHRATKRKLVQRHCDQALALLNSQVGSLLSSVIWHL